jgi:hypothetical protein
MRCLLPALLSALAALALSASHEASAAPRGGFRAGGGFAPIGRGGFVRAPLSRLAVARHHHRFHHGRFGRFGALAGFGTWAYGYGYGDGFGGSQVLVEQNVATGGAPYGYPSLYDLPAVAGIRSEPAAAPIIYVINAPAHHHGRVRKGEAHPGPKILSTKDGPETTGAVGRSQGGPRIVEVAVPR